MIGRKWFATPLKLVFALPTLYWLLLELVTCFCFVVAMLLLLLLYKCANRSNVRRTILESVFLATLIYIRCLVVALMQQCVWHWIGLDWSRLFLFTWRQFPPYYTLQLVSRMALFARFIWYFSFLFFTYLIRFDFLSFFSCLSADFFHFYPYMELFHSFIHSSFQLRFPLSSIVYIRYSVG